MAAASPSPPMPITREQANEIVKKIVERYKKKHNGNYPSYAWVNQRLQDQHQPFAIKVPAKPPAVTFNGTRNTR
jgi:hypothetical protein